MEDEDEEEVEISVSISTDSPEKNLVVGKGNIFKLTVENTGDELETFTFSAAGTIGWATHSIEPGIATIDEGETEDVYLYVSPKEDAEENDYPVSFYVKKDGRVIESIDLVGMVEEDDTIGTGFGDLSPEQMGIWIFIVVIIVIAILFSIWTYTTTTAAKGKKGKGKEKYY